jgi:hypothetical protein
MITSYQSIRVNHRFSFEIQLCYGCVSKVFFVSRCKGNFYIRLVGIRTGATDPTPGFESLVNVRIGVKYMFIYWPINVLTSKRSP